jgi:hypothetical protein
MSYSRFIQSLKKKFDKKKSKKIHIKENNLNKTTKKNETKCKDNVNVSESHQFIQTKSIYNEESKKSRRKVSFNYIQLKNHVIHPIEQNNLDLIHPTVSSSSLVHISLTIYDGKNHTIIER